MSLNTSSPITVSRFPKEDLESLQQLERLRHQGQLINPHDIEKWQYLYMVYQNLVKQSQQLVVSQSSPKQPVIAAENKSALFTIVVNGVTYTLPSVNPDMSLLTWLRSLSCLQGTKKSCGEGGCGACTVMLSYRVSDTQVKQISVNSCLRPLAACNYMSVTTVEGIGSQKLGFHPIQSRLAENNGTQCGFCSPGMVMAMYSLLTNNPHPTADEVEHYFDGNLCRCTGYRPIFTAFKTFAQNTSNEPSCKGACSKPGSGCKNACKFSKVFGDIEELPLPQYEKHIHTVPECKINHQIYHTKISDQSSLWFSPVDITQVFQYLNGYPTSDLVFGHTSSGIFKNWKPSVFISLLQVQQLQGYTIQSSSISFGACVTITDFLELLKQFNSSNTFTDDQKLVFPELIYLVGRIASIHIRNAGSIGGNIMLANKYSFPSDLVISLLGLGATLVVSSPLGDTTVPIGSFLNYDMKGKVLKNIVIPLGRKNQVFRTYKVAIRNVNAHSLVNSACSAIVLNNIITEVPTIAFGNIRSKQILLSETPKYLVGKDLNVTTLQGALSILQKELLTDPTIPKMKFRETVALSFFYKFFLSLIPNLPPNLVSAVNRFTRPVSSAEQSFQSDPAYYPVSEAIPKLRGVLQTSGEITYTGDVPTSPGTLHGAFVISTKPNADIKSIDPSPALALPGVTAWISVSDIPGSNKLSQGIPLFAEKHVDYAGQALGLIVADSEDTANAAAEAVIVTYENEMPAITTIADAISAGSFWPNKIPDVKVGDIATGLKESDFVITGSVSEGSQYHFHMETQSCLAIPGEDNEINLISATQSTLASQNTVASVLNIPLHKINVTTKYLGGGYGGKGANATVLNAASAVAAYKLQTPVRIVLPLETNMLMLGKRAEHHAEYTVGITKNGMLKAVQVKAYTNSGISDATSGICGMMLRSIDSCYYVPNFLAEGVLCKTNTPSTTYTRAPGTTPGIFIMEHIMEHVASFLSAESELIKQQNFFTVGQTTPDGTKLIYWNMDRIWSELKLAANYDQRVQEVAIYNKANLWTKRGLAIVPVRFGVHADGPHHTAMISIYFDGSVSVMHSGVEMGQGINTKVAQTVAYELGIPMSLVTIGLKTTTTYTPNVSGTNGSTGTENCCKAAYKAAQILNQRLAPVRNLTKESDWQILISKALASGIDLVALGDTHFDPSGSGNYQSYSACIQEVQLDILTGEQQLLRTDILFDAGTSLNPAVDIGQVEGSFVMGLGLHLTEEITYDTDGVLYNKNTWEYKPISAMDIPLDFRVTLLKYAPNPLGFLSSKATGEPAVNLGCVALFAIQHAASTQGKDIKNYSLNSPATVDNILNSMGLTVDQFVV